LISSKGFLSATIMNPPVIQTTYNFIPEIYNSTFKTGVFANEFREWFIAFLSKRP